MVIHVGLVGYGFSGLVIHVPLIQSVQGLTLTAIAEPDLEKVHKDYPTVTVVPTLERLLEYKEIALIVIATPNDTHYKLTKQALEAGRHVIVEKPFVTRSIQADELIAIAHKQQVILSIFHNRRWDNDFLTISHLIKTNLLGEIFTYEAHYDRYRPIVRDRWRERLAKVQVFSTT